MVIIYRVFYCLGVSLLFRRYGKKTGIFDENEEEIQIMFTYK